MNLLKIFGRDAYAYGLALLDAMFSKEELSKSLLFHSKKKTTRVPLDPERVSLLLSKFRSLSCFPTLSTIIIFLLQINCLDIKYKDMYDLKTFTQKANQKCCDTKFVGVDV